MIQVFTTNSIGIPERFLRVCDTEEVRTILQFNKETHGRWDKQKEMRSEGSIHPDLYWSPKLRHIFHNPDPKERAKLRARFFREHPRLIGK